MRLLFASAITAIACNVFAQTGTLQLSQEDRTALVEDLSIASSLNANTLEELNSRRERAAAGLFRQVGAEDGKIQRQPVLANGRTDAGLSVHNLILELPGDDADVRIVVGAHLDRVDVGTGTIDDWSGVVALAGLYGKLKVRPDRKSTYVFIAFAYEEDGLWGSRTYVNSLSTAERAKVKAMVNIECIGVFHPFIWKEGSTQALAEKAQSVGTDVTGVNVINRSIGNVGADSVPFFNAGIPAITIDSLRNPEDFAKIHSSEDTMSNIDEEHYFEAFRLFYDYLASLDTFVTSGALPSSFSPPDKSKTLPSKPFGPQSIRERQDRSSAVSFAASAHQLGLSEINQAIREANSDWSNGIAEWSQAIEQGGNQDEESAQEQAAAAKIEALYTPNAVMLTPEGEFVQGNKSIRRYLRGLARTVAKVRLTTGSVELACDNVQYIDGTVAYERDGRFKIVAKSSSNKRAIASTSEGKSFVGWLITNDEQHPGRLRARFHLDAWYPTNN